MTTRRSVLALTAAALATGLAFPVTTSSASPAKAAPTPRLVVLAGSADYLVYAEYQPADQSGARYAHGTLQVLDASREVQSLGPIANRSAPGSATGERYSLVGPILTASSAADPAHVQWWDLSGAGGGTATLPPGAQWAGSTPTGWAFVAADHRSVETESTDGTLTSYGTPVAAESATTGGAISAVTGPDGVVSVGHVSGQASYQKWSAPATVVPLDAGVAPGTAALACDSVSATIAACTDTGAGGSDTVKIALPLTGAPAQTYDTCPGGAVADGAELVYVCPATPAHPRFAAGAAVTRSAATVGAGSGVSALGSFVTLGATPDRIVGLSSATAPSRLLVTVALPRPVTAAELDAASLWAAADDVETEAINGGALATTPAYQQPAQVLLVAADALITRARATDPSLTPRRTTEIMGPVPAALRHRTPGAPRHFAISRTRTLQRFTHALRDSGSAGFGLSRLHDGAHPARPQRADGVYVDPTLPSVADETIGMVAMRTAIGRLGQPYVWAAAGPSTFDCSGLMQWSYAHAGIALTHFSGDQYNEGRLIPGSEILPGDLILFDHRVHGREVVHHVGMYLGAGWMINAPYTGQYVSVTQVPSGVAGIVRP